MKRLLFATLLGALLFAPVVQAEEKITVAIPDNVTSLDPADTNDVHSQSALRLMFQGLYGFDKDMTLIPVLAESYEVNADATEYTFRLRHNVTFHDGAKFDAHAVKISLDRLADPKNKLKRQSLLSMLDHVEVVDDYTVKIKLKSSFGALVNNLAHPGAMILSPKSIEQYGKEISRNPVGTGAFQFVGWKPDEVTVRKNENYWKPGLPHVDAVSLRSVPESGARIAMLQAGEADFIAPMPPEMFKVVEKNPDIVVQRTPSLAVKYLAFNTAQKPFDDLRVRQAMNYAVDKDAFVRVVYNGFARVSDSPLPDNLAFHSKQQLWPYDPEKAKQLLKEAGYENGFETDMWGINNTVSTRAMQFLQQQFAQVGIKAEVRPLESGVLYGDLLTDAAPKDSKLKMYYGGWSSSTGDADWALRPLFSTTSFPPTLYNVGFYNNADVDADIVKAMSTSDAAVKTEAYARVQQTVFEEAPWVFLGIEDMLSAHRSNVTGGYRIPDGGLQVEEIRRN